MSYQEKYLKYKSKYLNLRAEIHNNNLENRLEQNGGNLDILNVDQLSGTASITEKKYLMLGGSKENDLDLPDKLTETPVSEDKSTSEEKPKLTSETEEKSTSEDKPKKVDDDSSSEHDSEDKDESETHSSESLSPSSSEEVKQKGGRKDVKKNKKSSWFSDSELVSTDTTFMSFSTLDTSSESDL
jgi:hypothetical protein